MIFDLSSQGKQRIKVFWNGLLSIALLWAVKEREVIIHTDVSGQSIAPFCKVQNFLTVEVWSDWMSRNFSNKLPLYATNNPEERSSCLLLQQKTEITPSNLFGTKNTG
jgi:hypothetical protein